MSANPVEGVDAVHPAAAAWTQWQAAAAALVPIIGQRGMGALLRRCVHLSRERWPWLVLAADAELPPPLLETLQQVLASRSHAEASAADAELQQNFRHLLVNLIGVALTGRLLDPVWTSTTVQDTSQ